MSMAERESPSLPDTPDRIIYIDEDRIGAEFLCARLAEAGFELHWGTSVAVAEVAGWLTRGHASALLLHSDLADAETDWALARIRRHNPKLPIVVIVRTVTAELRARLEIVGSARAVTLTMGLSAIATVLRAAAKAGKAH
jgi:DNA-binding NtrC family response regulator